MKYFPLSIIAICFLASCTGPDKLLEDNRPEKAFYAVLGMKSEKKKAKYYPVLVAAYQQLQADADQHVEKLLTASEDNKWPHIYFAVLNGIERQTKAHVFVNNFRGFTSDFTIPASWQSRLEESRVKSAEYYYERVIADKMLGDAGSKMSYRSAHRLAERVEDFIPDYQDVRRLQTDLKILGTDYVFLYPEYGNNHYNGEWLWDDFVRDAKMPWTDEWVRIDNDRAALERVDYWLQAGIDGIDVGPNQVDNYHCSNSKEIKVGTKTEKVWSESDSAYVDVQVDIYQTVSISVTNTFQSKGSGAYLDLHLLAADTEEAVAQKTRSLSYNWQNSYGCSIGDDRAADINCSEEVGVAWSFPGPHTMVTNLEPCMRSYVKRFVKDNLEIDFRKRRNRRLVAR